MKTPEFKDVGFEDKAELDSVFSIEQPEISEYTFTNLFVWRKARGFKICRTGNGILITGKSDNKEFFFPPIGFDDINEGYKTIMRYAEKFSVSPEVHRVPNSHLHALKNSGLSFVADRNNFDYVYRTKDLAFLKGRHYDGKRGFVRKFFNSYDFECKEYSVSLKDKCLNLVRRWAEKKGGFNDSLLAEFNAIEDMLDNYERLNCSGCIAHIEDKVIGFSFGEELNKSTFVVHFEKADIDYDGIYQAINQRFVENRVLGNYDFINREQDLGIEGIRKAKKSYFPVKMIEKYIVNLA
jgi:hypothetical protein